MSFLTKAISSILKVPNEEVISAASHLAAAVAPKTLDILVADWITDNVLSELLDRPVLADITSNLPSLNDITGALPTLNDIAGSVPSISDITGALPSLSAITSALPTLQDIQDTVGEWVSDNFADLYNSELIGTICGMVWSWLGTQLTNQKIDIFIAAVIVAIKRNAIFKLVQIK